MRRVGLLLSISLLLAGCWFDNGGGERPISQPQEPPKSLYERLGQEIFQTLEAGRQQRRIRLVQHVADVVVGRNFLDPEQALAVRAALAFLQQPL